MLQISFAKFRIRILRAKKVAGANVDEIDNKSQFYKHFLQDFLFESYARSFFVPIF